jgi:hypothetical protein
MRQYIAWDDVAQILEVLGSELGKHEELGQNDGTCAVYQLAIGGQEAVDRHDSWCLYLALWGILQVLGSRKALAGVVPTITGSCEDFRRAARVTGQLMPRGTTPLPGDIGLVVNTATDHAHHAFTVSKSRTTLEGNSNDTGGSNGDGEYMRDSRWGPADPCTHGGTNHYELVRLTDPTDPPPAWLL